MKTAFSERRDSSTSKTALIAGGSGFIGRFLTKRLKSGGWKVIILSRSLERGDITWDQVKAYGLPQCDAVINLAGKHILDMRKRWNQAYMDELLSSRVETTHTLVNAINTSVAPPKIFLTISGKCFYGTSQEKIFHEHEQAGNDFSGQLCDKWESAAREINTDKVRHVHIRVGIVLGPVKEKLFETGILPLLRLAFIFGLGAKFGNGKQFFPWVHIDDVTGLMSKSLNSRTMSGTYNMVSPNIVRNEDFMHALGHALNRPVLFRIPASVIQFVVSKERMPILIEGQHVIPKRTLDAGYQFKFPDLDSALVDLVNTRKTGEQYHVYNH